jgi:hypothetical protein
VALENIVEQLEEQRARLQKELNAVVKMIRAAGKARCIPRTAYETGGFGERRHSPRDGVSNL